MPVVFLARHGPSASAPRGLLTAAQFADYLRGYDDVGLAPAAVLPDRLHVAAARCDLVVHSPLVRAAETAALLGRLPARQVWPELVEAAQPAPGVRGVRLPVEAWDVVTRVRWLLGRPGRAEPCTAATARARLVCDRLGSLTGAVLVVGHGFQNILIGRELRRRGWLGPRFPDHRHGMPSVYQSA